MSVFFTSTSFFINFFCFNFQFIHNVCIFDVHPKPCAKTQHMKNLPAHFANISIDTLFFAVKSLRLGFCTQICCTVIRWKKVTICNLCTIAFWLFMGSQVFGLCFELIITMNWVPLNARWNLWLSLFEKSNYAQKTILTCGKIRIH